MKKRLLILVEDYPNNDGGKSLMYVHTRNRYYIEHDMDVTVLNFNAIREYEYDGIKVITETDYKNKQNSYDVLILHAANIKHHYRFLKKYGDYFQRFIFFYHGHEVLKINQVYPKPYTYMKVDSPIKTVVQDIYDEYKLRLWRKYIVSIKEKSYFIFVSEWMKSEFMKWTKLDKNIIEDRNSIIYNCVSKVFEESVFDDKGKKDYDFITVRSDIDGSKYAIDIINKLAFNTAEMKFLVIGKGDYFCHNEKANNLDWMNVRMNHKQIVDILQRARFALMPTRTDAQGLMACEMAAFGIPVITSDISVCREVFNGFSNVYFINNENTVNLKNYRDKTVRCNKHNKYYTSRTVHKELEIIKEVCEGML